MATHRRRRRRNPVPLLLPLLGLAAAGGAALWYYEKKRPGGGQTPPQNPNAPPANYGGWPANAPSDQACTSPTQIVDAITWQCANMCPDDSRPCNGACVGYSGVPIGTAPNSGQACPRPSGVHGLGGVYALGDWRVLRDLPAMRAFRVPPSLGGLSPTRSSSYGFRRQAYR